MWWTCIENPKRKMHGFLNVRKLAEGRVSGLPAETARINADSWAFTMWNTCFQSICRKRTVQETVMFADSEQK